MTVKSRRCDELGVCQGLGPDQCPDCDAFECEVDVAHLQPVADRRQADRRYVFAPGVIEGPQPTQAFIDVDEWFALDLSLPQVLKLVAVIAALIVLGTYIGGRLV